MARAVSAGLPAVGRRRARVGLFRNRLLLVGLVTIGLLSVAAVGAELWTIWPRNDR